MTLNLENWELKNTEKQLQCDGKVFKANVYLGKTQKGIGFFVRLDYVKGLSCPGCKMCGGLEDDMNELNVNWPIIGIKDVEDGKYYRLGITNITTDFESGYADYWDLQLIPYKK